MPSVPRPMSSLCLTKLKFKVRQILLNSVISVRCKKILQFNILFLIQEFKEAFNMIDQNRDGFIDKEDLHDMLASLG